MEELVNDAFGRIGERVDSLVEDLIRNGDFHEDSPEFKGHEYTLEQENTSLYSMMHDSLCILLILGNSQNCLTVGYMVYWMNRFRLDAIIIEGDKGNKYPPFLGFLIITRKSRNY